MMTAQSKASRHVFTTFNMQQAAASFFETLMVCLHGEEKNSKARVLNY
jgi:hypothetical protein